MVVSLKQDSGRSQGRGQEVLQGVEAVVGSLLQVWQSLGCWSMGRQEWAGLGGTWAWLCGVHQMSAAPIVSMNQMRERERERERKQMKDVRLERFIISKLFSTMHTQLLL